LGGEEVRGNGEKIAGKGKEIENKCPYRQHLTNELAQYTQTAIQFKRSNTSAT